MAVDRELPSRAKEIPPIPRRLQAGSSLSIERAFVVHLGPVGGGRRRRFRGRVEHLSSGRTARFSSLRGLIEFLAAVTEPR